MSGLLLLDAPSMWFRAFYGVKSPAVAADGTPVNAVRGFFDVVARLIRDVRPDHLVACIDEDWRPQWRVDRVPTYKTHRVLVETAEGSVEEIPDELSPQVAAIIEVLDALGICNLGLPHCEADDVIGTLATRHDGPVWIVTGDRDLFQLVRDEPHRTRILYSVEQLRSYGPAEIAAKYGIPGTAYAEFALLRGDPSDGLPGVRGVGEKTAATLVNAFGTAAAVLAAAEAGPLAGFAPSLRQKVLEAKDYLEAAAPVVQVMRDAPIPPRLATALPLGRAVPEAAQRWSCTASVERVIEALHAVTDG
jgi:5'-3' exonuclease